MSHQFKYEKKNHSIAYRKLNGTCGHAPYRIEHDRSFTAQDFLFFHSLVVLGGDNHHT